MLADLRVLDDLNGLLIATLSHSCHYHCCLFPTDKLTLARSIGTEKSISESGHLRKNCIGKALTLTSEDYMPRYIALVTFNELPLTNNIYIVWNNICLFSANMKNY
jgi:hypothetical protein